MSIRALTTAIYLLQPPGIPSESPISSISPISRVLAKAYNHLAILLSQGTEGDDSGRRVVAVTGKTDLSAIYAVNEVKEMEDLPPLSHIAFTKNADRGPLGRDLLVVKKIEPNTRRSLYELADPTLNLPTQEVTLEDHGSDLFKALIDLSSYRHLESKAAFMRFVWLRCHRKMKARLRADEVLLGMPLYKILQEWKIEETDFVIKTYFRVDNKFYRTFDSFKIPFKVIPGKNHREYEFSHSTVPAWTNIFVTAFARVKDRAEKCDMQLSSIDTLNNLFFSLTLLLYDNRALERILAIRSLKARLIINPEQNVESEEDLDAPFDEDFDQGRNPIVRCCMAMVAWHRAGLSLSQSKIFKERLPEFHMVFSYRSPHNSSMDDIRTLMKELVLPKLTRTIPDAATHVDRILNDKFTKKLQFTGKIHCETTMMALVHSFTSKPPTKCVPPFTKGTTPDLRPLFSNADRVIGVARKSCLCCYWLGQLLKNDAGDPFVLPGTHGIVFPWTPPSEGIPIRVLESLQQKLISKLTEVTVTWIKTQTWPLDSNRQSSPTSQSAGPDDEDELRIDPLL